MTKGRFKDKGQMPKGRTLYFLLFIFYFFSFSLSALAQVPEEHPSRIAIGDKQRAISNLPDTRLDTLFSPSVGRKFYEIAYELANPETPGRRQTEQAIIFLTATMNLDSRANYVLPTMIRSLVKRQARSAERTTYDIQHTIYDLLVKYVDESADLEVAEEAISHLLEQLDSREQREELLKGLLQNLGGKNKLLDSELATLLGLLAVEKTNAESAQSYFMQAFNDNKYNKLAFEKLTELTPEQITPAIYLEHLRLALGENPVSPEAALAFAQYAGRLQLYETAADAYQYCAQLHGFLHPSERLPSYIYLPWAISCYNTQFSQHKCLQIADQLRQSGHFDLSLEAIAGKAAAKTGDRQQAAQILKDAEDQAISNFQSQIENRKSQIASQLAWFYCFAAPDTDRALDWANKAYSTEPNSAAAAALLAYSLVMNQQTEWAGSLIDNYQRNQIADLALAQIQLTAGQKGPAIETLKSAIARDPGSLVAEHAGELLNRLGSEYIPPTDPDIVLMALRNSFGHAIVPGFVTPENLLSVALNVRGDEFSYGSQFSGTVAITNSSAEPLVISDDGLFSGNIRIDAALTGDISKKIPQLVSAKIRPAHPIEPARSIFVPVRLTTGELKAILLRYPQASLDIEFTVYLDPVTTEQGVTNRLESLKPATLLVKRPGVKLTGKYLRNRLNSLTKGRQGQKIRTARLFAGLLAEQHAMANREPLYKFIYADWMPALLKSALIHNLTDDDWVVKVHTMAAMLSLPLDYELTAAVAENLNDTHWPPRLMAVYLLAKSQGGSFGKVLDHNAKYDPNKLVRDMAIALGGTAPQTRVTADQPNQTEQPQPKL